jgi:hypothetical protein
MAQMGVKVFHNLEEGIKDCDVVITLRLQNERMSGALLPSSQEYFESFGLTPEKLQLAKPDAIVMHPGPINRGVEIDSAVVDGQQSVILGHALACWVPERVPFRGRRAGLGCRAGVDGDCCRKASGPSAGGVAHAEARGGNSGT